MTKPKKWHLKQDNTEVFLNCSSGPLKKPNANETLGAIIKVTLPSSEVSGKIPQDEALLVSL